MNPPNNLDYILKFLVEEQSGFRQLTIPSDLVGKRQLMRSLINCRPPFPISDHLLKVQDRELQTQLHEKGIVELNQILISPFDKRIGLWQGDITRLKVDAIINAANSQMLGCFVPLHSCIDNAIHSSAGIQLRLECNEIMKKQGYPEPTGSAKITSGYNLPAKYVIHTVGPIVGNGGLTQKEESQLADCYRACLNLADKTNLKSIAFCCISTGEYRFPNNPAAEIALITVMEYFGVHHDTGIGKVVFNVYKDLDFSIYSKILKCGNV